MQMILERVTNLRNLQVILGIFHLQCAHVLPFNVAMCLILKLLTKIDGLHTLTQTDAQKALT